MAPLVAATARRAVLDADILDHPGTDRRVLPRPRGSLRSGKEPLLWGLWTILRTGAVP